MTEPQGGSARPVRPSRRAMLAGAAAATGGLAAAVAGGDATAAAAPSSAARRAPGPFPLQPRTFVTRRGGEFVLDGAPRRWAGINNYYLHYSSHYMIDSVLNDIAAMQLKTVRAWAFLDGNASNGVVLQAKPYVYDENGFEHLDYAVYKAGQLGLRLVLVLTNNWDDFGGMNQYVKWFSAAGHDDFYTNRQIRKAYRAYAKHVLNRTNRYTGLAYNADPTIMTWELANEPRCSSDTSGDTLVSWADEMSRYVSRFAPRQLVSVGDEGFFGDPAATDYPYTAYEGVAWKRLVSLPDVDYGTVHLYPVGWGESADPQAWGHTWITDHIRDGKTLGKPVVIEEFGLPDATQTKGYSEAEQVATYTDWTAAVESAGGAGDSAWIVTARTDDGTLYGDYDGFRIVYPSATATAAVLTAHAKRQAAWSPATASTAKRAAG
jgi:mannan endo-1,4-beta-mannosidase